MISWLGTRDTHPSMEDVLVACDSEVCGELNNYTGANLFAAIGHDDLIEQLHIRGWNHSEAGELCPTCKKNRKEAK